MLRNQTFIKGIIKRAGSTYCGRLNKERSVTYLVVTRSKVGKNIIILVANLKDDQNHFSSSVDVKSKVFFYISCNSDLLVVVIYVFKVSD